MPFRRLALYAALIALLSSTAAADAGGNVTWTSTGGPAGGFVYSLISVPSAPDVLYAGTNGGAYISRDAGAHWQPISDGLPDDRSVSALAVTPDGKVVLAGTPKGIYRSRDSARWAPVDARFADQLVLSLALDPQNPSTIYAGTANTVLQSENGGDTWSDVGAELRPVRVWSLAFTAEPAAVYAATDVGIYSSGDRGSHWKLSSGGLPSGARVQALANSAGGLLAGTTQGLYHSRDGKSWTPYSGLVASSPVHPILSDPRRPSRVVAATLQGLVQSTDGGSTWAAFPNAPSDTQILSLAFGGQNVLYLGTARGVWKTSDDGTTWQLLNAGLASSSIYSLLAAPDGPVTLLAATRFGLWFSQDQGSTWREARGLSDPYVLSLALDPDSPKFVYVGTWGGSLFQSLDSGQDLARLTGNLANNAPIASLAVVHLPDKTTLLYAGTFGNGVQKSSDGGRTWKPQSDGLGVGVGGVTALAFASPTILYAATDHGLYRLDVSKASASWALASPDLPLDEARGIVVDPSRPQTLFAVMASNGLYRSDNGGAKWRPEGRGAFPTRVRYQALTVNPSDSRVRYVGTDRGVYRTEDDGQTWAAANDGLPPGADIQAIVADPAAPERIYAGTIGSGVLAGTDPAVAASSPWPIWAAAGVVALALAGAGIVSMRRRLTALTRERAGRHDWYTWETAITNALWTFGQANEINLPKFPRGRLARALERYMEQRPGDGLTLQFSPLALKLDSYLPAQKLFSLWKAAWEIGDNEESFRSIATQMVELLCDLVGFTYLDERSYKGLVGYVVRAPSLRLKIPSRFPIIFIPHHQVGEEDIGSLRDLMGVLNMTSYFALIVDLRDLPAPEARPSLKRLVRQAIDDFIVLDAGDIRRLLAARDHSRQLIDIILDQVDLAVISPYVTSGPVPENMFFGRDHELKTIMRTLHDTNFAIVGGRKIGKTSVLARVHHLLQDAPEFQPFYLDCQAVRAEGDLYEAVETLWHTPLPEPAPEGFRRMVIDLLAQFPGRTIVMLFDEIDALLQNDVSEGERLFQILRALSQENQVRYIFCGEKTLDAALRDPRLVFFNFCSVLPLSYLTPSEARRVVIEPMRELGITLEDGDALADSVAELTAGHPNIVQYLCQKLIERINVRHERMITRADVDALSQSAQFAEYFTAVSWGNANALEQLITLMMLDQPEVTQAELADWLRVRSIGVEPAELQGALDGLCLYSILTKQGPKYAFASPALPSVLRRSQDVNGLRGSLLREIKNRGAQE